ncbi:hypothetical protein GCM10009637_02630 [Brevibacterium luteolum]
MGADDRFEWLMHVAHSLLSLRRRSGGRKCEVDAGASVPNPVPEAVAGSGDTEVRGHREPVGQRPLPECQAFGAQVERRVTGLC